MVRLRPSGRADGSERSLDVDKQSGFSVVHSPHRVRAEKLRSGNDAHEHLFFLSCAEIFTSDSILLVRIGLL